MNESTWLQTQINKLFLDKFKNYPGGENLSVPCIPRISKAYLKNRVVIIGQETNTWYPVAKDDLKNVFLNDQDEISRVCLEERYDRFVGERAMTYKGKPSSTF